MSEVISSFRSLRAGSQVFALLYTADIISVISSLSNSAAGYDEIPASIMKQLTFLINKSIAQGKFPNELKLAKVLPIYKKEDEQMIQNYRPYNICTAIYLKNLGKNNLDIHYRFNRR